MNKVRFFLFVCLLVNTQSFYVRPQDVKAALEPSGKVVEVYTDNQKPPSIISLRTNKETGFWGSNFPKIEGWRLPTGEDSVQVVNISAKLIETEAEVVVSVFKGKRFGEIVEVVARLTLSSGESAEVSELKKYGFQPIRIKMMTIGTITANVPLVSSPAPTLEVFVNPAVSTIPAFEVKLLNESGKSVIAIAWHTEGGGRRLLSSMPRGRYGEPLIKHGGEYVTRIRDSNLNPSLARTSLVIDTVIYDDGTFDGNPQNAATLLAFFEGERKALSKVVPLLREVGQADSQKLNLLGLITRIDAVTGDIEDKNGQSTSAVRVSFDHIIQDLVDAVRKLDSNSAGKSDAVIRNDLMEVLRFYEEWLKKLSMRHGSRS